MKILIAEDDTASRLVLGATLRKLGHETTAVADGRSAWEAWNAGDYPILVSDWMMPGIEGLELCRMIRAEARARYTYIVLLTALGGKGRYIDGIEAGADDFITKPFDEDVLAARLHVAERILALHETLRHQAMHDRLTGLWNRGAIIDSLQQELERAARSGGCVGVLLADLDRFKAINDTHGHAAGDEVLQESGLPMRGALRSYDRIGRYGGEEFLIVAPGAMALQCRAVGERVRTSVRERPVETGVGPLGVTVSIGAAISREGVRQEAATLIAEADEALYRAKRNGRNRVEIAQGGG